MTHILAFHAHPDDSDALCGGTLALLASKGHRITIVTMTAGDCGAVKTGIEETAAIRKTEAANAAAVIGAAYDCAGVPDLCVFNDDATRRKTVEVLRRHAPDVVITASPADYHPDHEATSGLVRDACFAVSVPNYWTGPSPAMRGIPHLYFMDPIGARNRDGSKVVPDFAVKIDAFVEAKRKMLLSHQSQFGWVAQQHGEDDYIAPLLQQSEKRGAAFGTVAAEAFRHYRGTPYPRSPLLQELVGDALLMRAV